MPEILNDKKVFSLLEVTKSIQKTIEKRYQQVYWIKAEMNKLNYYSHSGHCYPELVEKKDGKIITQLKANLWKGDFQKINKNFIEVLHEPLKDGIKILFSATIGYSPAYGLSLRIIDIDPSFTLGDLEKEKQETIKKLQEEEVFYANKQQVLSLLPQRIAIISVETSKGYADFLEILASANNSWHYQFFHMLFPSLLQGDNAVKAIIAQLRKIKKVSQHFDVVAIIRGGGGDVGLSCYNNFDLAKEIALFPIPVITGIGHATNETVSEMVSFKNEITPTKLAEYLIQKFHNFSVPIQNAQKSLIDRASRLLQEQQSNFNAETKLFQSVVKNILVSNRRNVSDAVRSLSQNLKYRTKEETDLLNFNISSLQMNSTKIIAEQNRNIQLSSAELSRNATAEFKKLHLIVNNLEKNVDLLSPKSILKRGFSITLHNGKALKSIDQINAKDVIKTVLFEGEIESEILNTKKGNNE